jgi:hypothetical protein
VLPSLDLPLQRKPGRLLALRRVGVVLLTLLRLLALLALRLFALPTLFARGRLRFAKRGQRGLCDCFTRGDGGGSGCAL